MKQKKYQRPESYLVVFFGSESDARYPIIERRSREEISNLKQNYSFKDMAIIEGDVVKGFGSENWGAI